MRRMLFDRPILLTRTKSSYHPTLTSIFHFHFEPYLIIRPACGVEPSALGRSALAPRCRSRAANTSDQHPREICKSVFGYEIRPTHVYGDLRATFCNDHGEAIGRSLCRTKS